MDTRQRSRLGLGLLAAVVLAASPVHAQQGAAPTPPPAAQPQVRMPGAEQIVVLVRSAILTLNDAVQTGNFTVLRDRAAPSFHAANSAARLALIFKSLTQQGVDLAAVAAIAPQLTAAPSIDKNQRLHVAGHFPGSVARIDFGLIFEMVGDHWRIFGISVNPAPPQSVEAELPKFAPAWDAVGHTK